MAILNIAPVSRKGMKLLISLYGMSQTGKTLSGLRLAAGIEPDPTKRGLLDTEGGERGRAYVDQVPGGYMYGKLSPPFTPERYVQALDDFEAAGMTTLVIDSGSHVWFGMGGVLDMAEASQAKNDLGKWIDPKRKLRKFINRLLAADMHVIICARAKQPLIKEMVDGREKLVPGPVVPIQEKNLRYDMTIIAHMLGDGRFTIEVTDGGKCPGPLRPIFSGHERMDEAMGRRLIEWIGGMETKTPEQRRIETAATEAAEQGSDAFRAFWAPLTPPQRAFLKLRIEDYQSAAKAADDEVEQRRREKDDNEPPEDPFGGGAPISIVHARAARDAVPPEVQEPNPTDEAATFWSGDLAMSIPQVRLAKGGTRDDYAAWAQRAIECVIAAPSDARLIDFENINSAIIAQLRLKLPDAAKELATAIAERREELGA